MSEIKTFSFTKEGIEEIKAYKYGSNWPVVYVMENGKEVYVGETIRAYGRSRQHMDNPARKRLNSVHIIADDESNKSATLDIESSLIEYMVADGKFQVQNGNGGMQNHDYYDRERYQSKFEVLWEEMRSMDLADHDWRAIKNSDLFKYSPYKTLTDDQYLVAHEILGSIKESRDEVLVVNGGPGTGKTIVATFLMKQLVDSGKTNIALVIAMTALRNTLEKVFRSVPGLKSNMVIGPAKAAASANKFDVILVDEAHRLRRRKNIPNYGSFDSVNKSLGLDKESDELDWILRSAKQTILFYDAKQSVRPSDILPEKISSLHTKEFHLQTQMRVKGGEEYVQFIDDTLEIKSTTPYKSSDYECKLFSDFTRFVAAIKNKEKQHSLSRMVAGYAWEWKSRNNKSQPDIEIDEHKLFWNSKLTDWVNSPNAPNEVGCIHTIQGYDLNYVGVIIGPEISYDSVNKEIIVHKDKYKDANGHRGVSDPEELKRYVINIYKTLLTRAILGTFIYVVDDNLREYFAACLNQDAKKKTRSIEKQSVVSPYTETVKLPLFDSIGCGEAMFANSTPEEMIEVPAEAISKGAKYFVLRTSGDSMNKLGIQDGDLILCQKNYQAPSGSVAVVMIGDDAALKEIEYLPEGLLLKPKSSNTIHQERLLGEYDDFKVLGMFIKRLEM